jgi:hypothetical protein
VTTFTGQLLSACNLRTFVGAPPVAASDVALVSDGQLMDTCQAMKPGTQHNNEGEAGCETESSGVAEDSRRTHTPATRYSDEKVANGTIS